MTQDYATELKMFELHLFILVFLLKIQKEALQNTHSRLKSRPKIKIYGGALSQVGKLAHN